MGAVENIITDNLPLWSSSVQLKSTRGRGSSSKRNLYGVKKLRELILDLAVRGLLVPQDPNDEPAALLLEKISAERAFLIKNKTIRKAKVLNKVSEQEVPYKIPSNWVWIRLNDIGDWGAGATPRRGRSELYGGDIPWFKSGELTGDFISQSEETVTELALKESSLRLNKVGDVLLAMYGATIGKASILNIDGTTNQAVCACTAYTGISNIFLLTLLKAYRPRFISMGAGGAQPNISREKIIATPAALPPLAEQHRIVAKVDELMALCDTLEQQQENSIEAHETLVETLFSALTNAADAEAFQSAWQRVSKHFDTLLTTEHSVDKLKETILQLAVTGKLVPQDPNDEPASVMLEKISADKEHLIKEDKIKKQKSILKIGRDEQPIKLPKSWELVRLGDLSPEFQNGASSRGDKEGIETVVFRLADIENWKISTTDNRYLLIDPKSTARYSIKKNDVLIIRVNGSASIVGRFIFCDTDYEGIYCDHFIRMRFHHEIFSTNYLTLLASSDLVRKSIENMFVSTAGQKTVNQKHIASLLVSIPPLAEQHRIVAKVDELMNLCDDLKQSLNEAQTTQMQLTDAVVENAF